FASSASGGQIVAALGKEGRQVCGSYEIQVFLSASDNQHRVEAHAHATLLTYIEASDSHPVIGIHLRIIIQEVGDGLFVIPVHDYELYSTGRLICVPAFDQFVNVTDTALKSLGIANMVITAVVLLMNIPITRPTVSGGNLIPAIVDCAAP